MKITHIALLSIVNDYWTYQDNLLPKYQKINGHDVTIITSKFIYGTEGKITIDERDEYTNENGIKVIRLKTKNNRPFSYKFKKYSALYETIENEHSDVLFVHGCQFIDIATITKYAQNNPKVTIYIDNHADFKNSGSNWLSRNVLHKVIWRYNAKRIEPYTTFFFGVLPARVDFLRTVYKLPEKKIDLLVMGADDELVNEVKISNMDNKLRKELSIQDEKFLIVTGGKFDNNKVEILDLMRAVNNIQNQKIMLVIFGSIDKNLEENFYSLISEKIKYIGWIDYINIYKYFEVADIIMFPGLHSVLWEQAVGLGKPCVFKYIEGFTHIDLNGNCKYLYKDGYKEIQELLEYLINNNDEVKRMELIAKEKGMQYFSYSQISRRALSKNTGEYNYENE